MWIDQIKVFPPERLTLLELASKINEIILSIRSEQKGSPETQHKEMPSLESFELYAKDIGLDSSQALSVHSWFAKAPTNTGIPKLLPENCSACEFNESCDEAHGSDECNRVRQ